MMCEELLAAHCPLCGLTHSPISVQGFKGRKQSQNLLTLLGMSISSGEALTVSHTGVTSAANNKFLTQSVQVLGLEFIASPCTLQLLIRLLNVKSKSKEEQHLFHFLYGANSIFLNAFSLK